MCRIISRQCNISIKSVCMTYVNEVAVTKQHLLLQSVVYQIVITSKTD